MIPIPGTLAGRSSTFRSSSSTCSAPDSRSRRCSTRARRSVKNRSGLMSIDHVEMTRSRSLRESSSSGRALLRMRWNQAEGMAPDSMRASARGSMCTAWYASRSCHPAALRVTRSPSPARSVSTSSVSHTSSYSPSCSCSAARARYWAARLCATARSASQTRCVAALSWGSSAHPPRAGRASRVRAPVDRTRRRRCGREARSAGSSGAGAGSAAAGTSPRASSVTSSEDSFDRSGTRLRLWLGPRRWSSSGISLDIDAGCAALITPPPSTVDLGDARRFTTSLPDPFTVGTGMPPGKASGEFVDNFPIACCISTANLWVTLVLSSTRPLHPQGHPQN